MLDNEKREQIALKKFSLIGPVLNGQVDNQKEYFIEITSKAIDMPHYGMRMYSPKTLASWLSDYRRGGIDALIPRHRGHPCPWLCAWHYQPALGTFTH